MCNRFRGFPGQMINQPYVHDLISMPYAYEQPYRKRYGMLVNRCVG